jgi:hypothetical protein
VTDPQLLMSRYFAGAFSSRDIAELRAWILSDPANALEYARASFVHNTLHQTFSGDGRLQDLEHLGLDETIVGVRFEQSAEVCEQLALPIVPEMVPVIGVGDAVEQPGTPGVVAPTQVSRNRFPWRIAAAILVPLVLAIGAWSLFHSRASSAILVASVDTQWGPAFAQPALGAGLPGKTLDLKAGLAKVRFASGAEMIVQGPARFHILSNNAVDLDAGRLTALVTAPAHGFTVQTPSAIAVDLGTEFGVAVSDDGSTHIEVFRGNVQARALQSSNAAGAAQILTAGEASDVAAGATAVSAALAAPSQFVREDEFDARAGASEGSSYQRWLAFSYQLRRDPDLVAYYTFDNAAENPDRLLNHSSLGAALDGILGEDDPEAKPTWTTGRWSEKGAVAFDPVHYSHIIVHSGVGDPLDFSRAGSKTASPFTIAAWIRVDVQPDDDAAIIAKGFVGAEQFGIDTGASLKLQDWIRDTAASRPVAGVQIFGNPIALGSWVMLVATYDSAQRITRLYVNGQLDAHSDGVPQKLVSTDQPVTIGARRDTKSDDGSFTYVQPFEGRMDELAFFRRAISAEQVLEIYKAGKPD